MHSFSTCQVRVVRFYVGWPAFSSASSPSCLFRRTSTASARSQCSPPDFNHKENSQVLRFHVFLILHNSNLLFCQDLAQPDVKVCQKICPISCQKDCQNRGQIGNQKEYQKICQIEFQKEWKRGCVESQKQCQKRCQIECQKECQRICQIYMPENGSIWHVRSNGLAGSF